MSYLKSLCRLPKRRSGKYKKGNAQILESGDDYIEPTHQVIAHVIEEHIEGYEGKTSRLCCRYSSSYGDSFDTHLSSMKE